MNTNENGRRRQSAEDDLLTVFVGASSLHPPLTGIGRYAKHLVAGLLDRRSQIERVECFSGWSWAGASHRLDALRAGAPVPRGPGRLKRHLRGVPGIYSAWHAVTGAALRIRAPAASRSTVYHEPNYILRPLPVPAVVSCHDLSFLRHPEHHPRERVRHLERHLAPSLDRAARVLTDSEFVRIEVIERFGLPPSKVVAIPLGVEAAFHPRTEEACAPALRRLGLAYGSYVLAVATVEPRKNLDRMVAAYEMLPVPLRRRFPLVVAGAKGWSTSALENRMSRLQDAGELKRPGYVPEEDLPALYAGCAAFVYPSLYEGFGLPPLEAMACGVPVVVSGTSSIPEVVGDAGIMVDPLDESAIAEGLRRALEDGALRRELASKGPGRAALFTWDRCVDRTVEVYREVLA